eukprot:TRINITY_DN9045_c0_g1_i1.p1 TRINITY_DN9045_c0_g1~~TRINITY_DN9045_c0_g1_i1.p1  ORF type:complete len:256 (-),score=91.84 TRINITY_DN9045_c0_g1_i1:65-832(-)
MSVDDESMSGSLLIPQEIGALGKGDFIQIKGHPCKIHFIDSMKVGKHGHAKTKLTAVDVFTGKKYDEMAPSSHSVYVPIVKKSEWQVMAVDNSGYVSLMQGLMKKDDVEVVDEALGKGDFIQIKGHPCKIHFIDSMKVGKHGHAKTKLTAVDVFTGKKYDEMAPSSHSVYVPIVKKSEWQVMAVDNSGYVSLMQGLMKKDDVEVVDEALLQSIEEGLESADKDVFVTLLSAPQGPSPEQWELKEVVVEVNVRLSK